MIAFGCLQPRILFFLGAVVFAQPSLKAVADPAAPNTFYQKNFADAPKVGGDAMVPPESPRIVAKSSSPSQHSSRTAVTAAGSDSPVPQEGNKKGEVRTLISLYVSSQTRGHFEAVVRKAFHVAATNRNIKLAEIYHIGDYRNVTSSVESDAKARGIVLVGLSQVPAIWPVKDSPVWILRDSKGEHIVEGLLQIDRCISPQGEYREPERSMFEAPATPTMGVKSF